MKCKVQGVRKLSEGPDTYFCRVSAGTRPSLTVGASQIDESVPYFPVLNFSGDLI